MGKIGRLREWIRVFRYILFPGFENLKKKYVENFT